MTTPVSPELQSKIASWRLRAAAGELSLAEMKEAVLLLRAGRVEAAKSAASTKRKAAHAAIPHAEDLLNEIEGL